DYGQLYEKENSIRKSSKYTAQKIYHHYQFAIAGSPPLDFNTLAEFVRKHSPRVILLAPLAYGSYHAAELIALNQPIVAMQAAGAGGMSLLILAASLFVAKALLEHVNIDLLAKEVPTGAGDAEKKTEEPPKA
ncbi:MAG: hypothetical protein KC457_34650, partial [Myxococcales bacterium]|nr:hypothetical protein [Myxococcales bacterium]